MLLTYLDLDTRTNALFCQACRDFVYDHELEKIRSRAVGLWPRDPLDGDGCRATSSIESAIIDAYSQAKTANSIALAQDTVLFKPSRYVYDVLHQLSIKNKKRKAHEISKDESNGDGYQPFANGVITTTEVPEADENYIKANASKRTCQTEGVRGLFNLGQTCYMNVVLQTLLHEPLLNAYFLGNGHKYYDCQIDGCVLCAMSRAYAEFNGCDKKDGFTAETLLYSTWKNHPVCFFLFNFVEMAFLTQNAYSLLLEIINKMHMSSINSLQVDYTLPPPPKTINSNAIVSSARPCSASFKAR